MAVQNLCGKIILKERNDTFRDDRVPPLKGEHLNNITSEENSSEKNR